MKKFLITAISICFCGFSAMAQPQNSKTEKDATTARVIPESIDQPMVAQNDGIKTKQEERKENIESMKIAFITQKLDLSPAEAQQFWPVYNEYSAKQDDIRKKRREIHRKAKQDVELLTDKEVEQTVDNEIVFRQKELDLQKEYLAKFKTVLPIKKVAKLYAAEDQFKLVLLDRLKDRDKYKDKDKGHKNIKQGR